MSKQLHQVMKKQLNNKHGFTMAELLVVLAITIILFGIGMLAVINYAKDLKRVEMDNAAKEIFMAAQNHLSELSTSGQLLQYVKGCSDTIDGDKVVNKASVGIGLMSDFGTNGTMPSDMPEGYDMEWSDLRYLIYPAVVSLENPDANALSDSLLGRMLPQGSIDDDVRTQGSYVVEYSPVNGMIYSVFYMEDADLTYADVQTLNIKSQDVSGRSDNSAGQKIRRNYSKGVVGYYGGPMVSTLSGSVKDGGLKLTFNNGDILQAVITDKNYFLNSDDRTSVTLVIQGRESKSRMEIKLPLTDNSDNPSAKLKQKNVSRRIGLNGELKQDNTYTMNFWDVETVTDGETKYLQYTVNLDDITVSGGHFAEIFNTSSSNNYFIPGENIEGYVYSTYEKQPIKVVSKIDMTNSLFEKLIVSNVDYKLGAETFKKSTAYVTSARHIENLDAQISNIVRADLTGSGQQATTTDVIQSADIDWTDFITDKEDGQLKKIYPYSKGSSASVNRMTGSSTGTLEDSARLGMFFPVARRDIHSFTGAKIVGGKVIKQYKISNIKVNNTILVDDDSGGAGLFRGFSLEHDITVKHMVLENFEITGYNAGALSGTTYAAVNNTNASSRTMDIENIIVKNCKINAVNNAGGVFGVFGKSNLGNFKPDSDAIVKNILVISDDDDQYSIVGGASSGGLMGNLNYTTGYYVNLSNCTTRIPVIGTTYAGGIIGNNDTQFIIEDSYSGGATDQNGKGGYSVSNITSKIAGGIVGYSNASKKKVSKINNCYSTCFVKGKSSSGGLIGQANASTTLDGSYFAGFVQSDEGVCGTLVGAGAATFSNCKYVTENEGNIIALGDKGSDPVGVNVVVLSDAGNLGEVSLENTHRVNLPVTKGAYPFGGVNRITEDTTDPANPDDLYLGLVEESEYVHYGDWITEVKTVADIKDETNVLIAYREKIGTKYNWQAWAKDGTEKVNDLNKFYSGIIEDAVYGVLVKSGIDVGTWDTDDFKDPVEIFFSFASTQELISYQFYEYKGSETEKNISINGDNLKFNVRFASNSGMNIGTEAKPYIIRTSAQFSNIVSYPSAYYQQTYNINLDNSAPQTSPIINASFTGVYDGKNCKITGLNQVLTGDAETSSGLFKEVSGTVKNINLSGAINSSVSNINLGGITGLCSGGTIEYCTSNVDLSVEGASNEVNEGLLVGKLENNGTIKTSYGKGKITIQGTSISQDNSIGGLVGLMIDSKINQSWSMSRIERSSSGSYNIGGLVGQIKITSSVTDTDYRLENCYANTRFDAYVNPSKSYEKLLVGKIVNNTKNKKDEPDRAKCGFKSCTATEIDADDALCASRRDYTSDYLGDESETNKVNVITPMAADYVNCYLYANIKYDNTDSETIGKKIVKRISRAATFYYYVANMKLDTAVWKDGTRWPVLINNLDRE